METDLMVKSMGDKESIEGIDAFLEKREPDYKKLRKLIVWHIDCL